MEGRRFIRTTSRPVCHPPLHSFARSIAASQECVQASHMPGMRWAYTGSAAPRRTGATEIDSFLQDVRETLETPRGRSAARAERCRRGSVSGGLPRRPHRTRGTAAREVRPHVTVRRARDVVLDRAVALTTPVSSAGTCSPRTYCSGPTRAGRRGPVAAGDDAVRRRRGARCAGVRRSPQRRRPRRRASADASGRSRRRCRSRTGRAFPARKRCTGCLPRWWRAGHLDADLKGKVTRVYPYEG
jgi:hypothetical protein